MSKTDVPDAGATISVSAGEARTLLPLECLLLTQRMILQHTNGRCRRMFASSQAGGFLRMSQNGGEEEEDWRIPLDTKAVKVFALSDVHADFRSAEEAV
eukprot:550100-Rhodomonas_salina.2